MIEQTESITTIPLANIIDVAGVPDRPLDPAHVAALVATNEPDKWEPIIVTPVGIQYGRIAGKHRIAAAHKLGRTSLRAVIRYYSTQTEMYMAMWEDNARNGKPLTMRERKEYAANLHRLEPGFSLRELGRRAGLPHQTVKVALEEGRGPASPKDEETEQDAIFKQGKRMVDACKKFMDAISTAYPNGTDAKEDAAYLAQSVISNADINTVDLLDWMSEVFLETSKRLGEKIA